MLEICPICGKLVIDWYAVGRVLRGCEDILCKYREKLSDDSTIIEEPEEVIDWSI